MSQQREYGSGVEPRQPVRQRFWGLMIVVVLIAFMAPVMTMLHASAMPLFARACLWPRAPQVDQATWLIVTLPEETDQAATAGPWARATVAWGMPAMTMGASAVAIPGSAHHAGIFATPLRLTMAGAWSAHVALATPGRPVWRGDLLFMVGPGPMSANTAAAALAPALSASSGCALKQVAAQAPGGL